ncbi:unnamed protein product [Schistosoma turkestanicum]|nr:unnamed protein product [Schistosoma turkestanicum]
MWCSYALLITLFHSVILKDVQHHKIEQNLHPDSEKLKKYMECEFGRLNLKYSPKLFKDLSRSEAGYLKTCFDSQAHSYYEESESEGCYLPEYYNKYDINRLSNTLEMERMFINEYNLDSFAYRILGRVLMEINKLSAPTHIQRLSPAMTIGI